MHIFGAGLMFVMIFIQLLIYMKTSFNYLFNYLFVPVCCLTSCVDSKYDLADVDTDNVIVGETWVAPLGTGFVETEDLVRIDRTPSVQVEPDGSYVMRYEGTMRPNRLRAGGTMIEAASAEIPTDDLSSLFEGEFVLSLADPHILLQTGMKSGSVDARLDLASINSRRRETTSANFPIAQAKPNIWIGANQSAALPGYLFVQNDDLNGLIAIVPERMQMSLLLDAAQAATLPEGALDNVKYIVEAPLAPDAEFRATSVEHISNAFDESFASYLFKSGTATIFGEVTNEMPVDLSIEMLILDADNKPLAITFPQQSVKGSQGPVEFVITEKDMPKMEKARHIELRMHLIGREKAEVLKEKKKITLNLKIRKDGGIAI